MVEEFADWTGRRRQKGDHTSLYNDQNFPEILGVLLAKLQT